MDLSLYEQETIIGFCEEEKTAGIYTQAGGLQTRPCIPRWTGG